MRDADFVSTSGPAVVVSAGLYNRYIVANNISYGKTPSLGRGTLPVASVDAGTASLGKVWANNLLT